MIAFPDDAVTRHAFRVLRGEFIAGPHVRDACARHIRDLVTGAQRGLTWHVDEVERVIAFFAEVLTVEVEVVDEFGDTISEAVPFVLHEAQEFIVGSLFGWKNRLGHRRFRRAYIEQGKGNGKSPLAAGIGHYMLTATRKLRAEIYSAATDRDQAMILFRDAVEMWRRSPHLFNRLTPSGQNPTWRLADLDRAGFFTAISSDKKGKSGIRPYCALVDEVHEHPNQDVIEMLRAGTKGNQQALIFLITNSGTDPRSVCGVEHAYAMQIAAGELENDAYFCYVCALDKDDDPLEDESCWIKANPLLGVSIFPEFIREQVAEAKGMPTKESVVRRLHFCQWTEGEESWITRAVWEACEHELKLDDYHGRECYGGLDMSYTADLSAFALAFPTSEDYEEFDLFVWFWKPKVGLKDAVKRDAVRYDLWHEQGFLELTKGKVIRLAPIGRHMGWVADHFDLRGIGYDQYRHKELAEDLQDLGIEDLPLIEHPQGFRRAGDSPLWMPDSVQTFENAIVETRVQINSNPLLTYNAAQTVIREDPSGTDNKIFDKRKSRARIDGIVAAAMAVGTMKHREELVFEGVSFDDLMEDYDE